ncbi:MAG: TfoX/Sxy family protein [Spirochaetaceae bacterium]|nr:TfoX/Sxy family protein [Spirochaetaceae bacterium]
MAWTKAPADMTDWLTTQMEHYPLQYRPMFGYPTWFYNGNMFSSVHGENIMLRLKPADQAAMMEAFDEVQPFVALNGKAMKDYVMFSADLFSETPELQKWFDKGFEHVKSLPVKEPKVKKSK